MDIASSPGAVVRSVRVSFDERSLVYEDLHQRHETRNEIKGGESNGPVNGAMEQRLHGQQNKQQMIRPERE